MTEQNTVTEVEGSFDLSPTALYRMETDPPPPARPRSPRPTGTPCWCSARRRTRWRSATGP